MKSNFEERRMKRLATYGVSITRKGKTLLIKGFPDSENNLSKLEQLRKIFYPQLKKNLRIDKTKIKIFNNR